MQVLPSKEISHVIKHFLYLESAAMPPGSIRLFADGHPGIVFSLQNRLLADAGSKGQPGYLPGSFLYGQVNRHKDIFTQAGLSIIIAVLQPAGASLLTGIPARHLKENIIDAADLLGNEADTLQQKLRTASSVTQKCRLLDSYFIKLIAKRRHPDQWLLGASLQYIHAGKGLHSIAQLVKYTGYTERHLDRHFSEWVGLSPKAYSNIVQLHCFLKLLKAGPGANGYTPLAYEAGYADQSHLIKSFKKITGITPSTYIKKTQKLAVNFIRPMAEYAGC
jgi:AraC-like DNA-binding protein